METTFYKIGESTDELMMKLNFRHCRDMMIPVSSDGSMFLQTVSTVQLNITEVVVVPQHVQTRQHSVSMICVTPVTRVSSTTINLPGCAPTQKIAINSFYSQNESNLIPGVKSI